MTITQFIIKLVPWNYVYSIENKILVKIKLKRDTRLQKKIDQSSIFLATVVKIPAFFHFFCSNGLNFYLLAFNI